jgi:hypothetical protein
MLSAHTIFFIIVPLCKQHHFAAEHFGNAIDNTSFFFGKIGVFF